MTTISKLWLDDRGGLHDARVTSVELRSGTLSIAVDDEWANEHDGEPVLAHPGLLSLKGAVVIEGDPVPGGWISEVSMIGPNILVFDFCDRERLVVRCPVAEWLPTIERVREA